MIRQTVHFTGQVQGVGFRFTASQIARKYQVTGCVRNLADGRVELIAEGETQEITRFLASLADHMEQYIRQIDKHEGEATGEFAGFAIVP